MNKKNAVALIDDLILATKTLSEKIFDRNKLIKPRDSGLVSIESSIIEGVWDGENYDMIAKYIGLSKRYVSNYGGEFWELLTVALQEIGIDKKVTKKSLKALIEVEHEQIRERLANYKNNYSSTTNPIADNHIFLENKQLELPEGAIASDFKQFKSPKGAISPDSPFYIKRSGQEEIAREEIKKERGLLKIQGKKKTGKSSLLMRILRYAQSSYLTVSIDFHFLDRTILTEPNVERPLEKVLKWLLISISVELDLEEKLESILDKNWHDTFLGEKGSFTNYFKKKILSEIDKPIILALDKVDYLFDNPDVALDFFGLLRGWHDVAVNDLLLKKIRFILVYCQNLLPKDAKQSPFNIGTTVILQDFNLEQIEELANKYSCNWNRDEIKNVVEKIGKNPYIVHDFIGKFSQKQQNVSNFLLDYCPTSIESTNQ